MRVFLLRLIQTLILLSCTIPLIRSSTSFFGNVVDRTLVFWLITEIITASWVLLCTLDPAYIPTGKRLITAMSVWLLALIASTVFANSLFLSFFSTFERMMGLLTYVHLFFFFVVVSEVLRSEDWENLLVCLFIAGFISSLLAFYFRFERNLSGRVTGLLGNPSFLASYTVSQIVITCLVLRGIWMSQYRKFAFGIAVIALPLHFSVVFLSGSRSGILSLIVGFFVVLLLLSVYNRQLRYWFLGSCAVTAIAFFSIRTAGPVANWLPSELSYLQRVFDVSINTETFLTRRNLWGVAWDAVCEHPLLGWGFEGFSFAFLKHYDPSMYKDGLWYDNPHNIFLEWLINGGVLGLLGFTLCFGLSFFLLWKNKDLSIWTKSLLTGYGTAYLCFNFNNFDSLSSALLLFTFWAFIEFSDRKTVFDVKPLILSGRGKLLVQVGTFVVASLCVYAFIFKTYRSNQALYHANENPDLAVSTFAYKKLYESALIGKFDVLIQAGLRRNSIAQNTEKAAVENYYLVTHALLENGLRKFNNSGQILNQLGHLNVFVNQPPKAAYYFEQFRTLAPRRQANLMDLGIVYIENGEFGKAISVFDYIYNLNRSHDYPLIYKAIAQANLGSYDDARKTIGLVSARNIAENGELTYMAMDNQANRKYFCELYSGMTEAEAQLINQRSYFMWMNAAFDLKDYKQLRSAFNSYRYNFSIPESEIMPILEAAIRDNVRPDAVTQFFNRYPGR